VGSRNHVLDGVQMRRDNFRGRTCPAVPDDTLPSVVQKWLNQSRCRLGCGLSLRMRQKKHTLHRSARRRHLTNTIGPSLCGGDAAFCQITLTTIVCLTAQYTVDQKGATVFLPTTQRTTVRLSDRAVDGCQSTPS